MGVYNKHLITRVPRLYGLYSLVKAFLSLSRYAPSFEKLSTREYDPYALGNRVMIYTYTPCGVGDISKDTILLNWSSLRLSKIQRRIPTISQTTVSQRESFSTDRFPTTDSQYDSFSNDIFSTRQFLKQTISQHDIFSTDIIATRHILKRHFPKRQFLNFYWFHDIFPIPLNKTTVSQLI